MPPSLPEFTAAWTLPARRSGIDSLNFIEKLPLPTLKDDEVLVKIHAVSLNYRELMIVKAHTDTSSTPRSEAGIVPASDGAGVVVSLGPTATAFRVGDRICTHMTVGLSDTAIPLLSDVKVGLGDGADGTLRQYGVFRETSLVKMPANLNFLEAATLTCSGLTAWNALFGIESKAPKNGDVVVVQGSGGVSVAALQFALAAGATVIATSSSSSKADKLKSLGASHVLNYREISTWGAEVKSLTPDGRGAHIVVDVGGASTLSQSLAALRSDGLVALTGILGGASDSAEKPPTLLDCLWGCCTARGLFLGTRKQFDDMCRFIETHDVKPVPDERVFEMSEVKEAYQALEEQRHFSKIGIRVC